MAIIISDRLLEKLATKHNVKPEQIAQCFANRTGKYLFDTRAKHASNPPTRWFISEDDYGRKLKVVFVPDRGDIFIRTAYDPDAVELRIYKNKGGGTN